MIITDKFVYIHLPKTGGSFVSSALLVAHGIRWNRWHYAKLTLLGRLVHHGALGTLRMQDKHGSCSRIPATDVYKPILSTIRNPLDYYVSDYEFGWWKRREWHKYYRQLSHFAPEFPAFPDLSFPDYLRLMSAAFNPQGHRDFEDPDHLGYFSASFIKMFFREPTETFERIHSTYPDEDLFQNDLNPVTFITTQDLNQQLFDFLLGMEYPVENIQFILDKKPVLPLGKGRKSTQKWEQYYTPELIELVQQKDRLLFKLFPTFDPQLSV